MDGNTCPECGGFGAVTGECIYWGNDYEPPEYADEECPVCDGEGIITTPLTESEVSLEREAYRLVPDHLGYVTKQYKEDWP